MSALQVAVSDLAPDPHQPRKHFDKASLATLVESITARGVLTPLLVRQIGETLVIVDGERRWRAAQLAGIESLPCVEVGPAEDVQTRLDQVAINNLREPLRPMELARLVKSLRDDHRLTENDIAARLEKDGIPYQGKAALATVLQLCDLPRWAQEMVDAGALDTAGAGKLLAARADADVLKACQKSFTDRVSWSGRVNAAEAERITANEYLRTSQDLRRTEEWHTDPVLFDAKKACKGCENLRVVDSNWYCRNKQCFAERQEQAKAAGLGPGGKKPKKKDAPAKVAAREEEQRVERRERSTQEKLAEYFDAWLRAWLANAVAVVPSAPTLPGSTREELANGLADYLTAGMPHGRGWDGEPNLLLYSAPGARAAHAVAAHNIGITALPEFLGKGIYLARQMQHLAQACIKLLTPDQARWIIKDHLGQQLAAIWLVDAEYLALKRKADLRILTEKGGCTEFDKLGVAELRQKILTTEGAAEQIGVPPDIEAIWDAPFEPAPDDNRAQDDDVGEDEAAPQ